MAKTRRVALALSEQADDVLTQLSTITGQPKTAIITEILNDSVPMLSQVIQAIKELKEGNEKNSLQTMAKFLSDTSNQLNQAHLDLGEVKGKHGL